MDLHVDLGSQPARRATLEARLRDAIRSGRLRPGARLPSSRALAESLGTSRGVVVRAYGQLTAEGLLDARAGSGTVVAAGPSAPPAGGPGRPPRAFGYDLRPGYPDLAHFPRARWARAVSGAIRTMPTEELGYGSYNGLPALRRELAAYLDRARATRADPEAVLITSGIAPGLLQACTALHRLGARRVGVEEPGWRWQVPLAEQAGLVAVPVPADAEGPRLDVVTGAGLDALFVTPSHQFPHGTTMSARRRSALVGWAAATDGYLLEDDYDSEYCFADLPLPSLQGVAAPRVIYAGTVSKSLAPGLRLGWLVVPDQLLDAVSELRAVTLSSVSAADQFALAELLASGGYDRHLGDTRRSYRPRRDALLAALDERLPALAGAVTGTGLHLHLPLPADVDELAVAGRCQAADVGVYAARQVCTVRDPARQALLLGFARLPARAARPALTRIAEALHGDSPAPPPGW